MWLAGAPRKPCRWLLRRLGTKRPALARMRSRRDADFEEVVEGSEGVGGLVDWKRIWARRGRRSARWRAVRYGDEAALLFVVVGRCERRT
jgi:hypothetical protein